MSFQKKFRFIFRLIFAFVRRWFYLIFLGAVLGIIFLNLAPRISKYIPQSKNTIKIGVLGKYTLEEVPQHILQNISRGLTKVSPEGSLLPDLSSSWEISEDGKIYTFYFDQKYLWHDGGIFNPSDINYNFKDAQSIPGDYRTLKFKLNEPFGPFLSVVSRPIFKRGLVGLGEYKIKKIERTGNILTSISLVPADRKSTLPNLVYRFYINDFYLKIGFKLGEIDKIDEIDNLNNFTEYSNLKTSSSLSFSRQVVLFFNTSLDPFSEKNFRQAIAYAIGKEEGKKRAPGPIGVNSWFFNPGVKKYEKDLEKTKLLLANLKLDENKVFSISTFSSLESVANQIKEQLLEIGINTEIRILSSVPDDFEMFLAIQELPLDPDQYLYWHSGQQLNLCRFSNPRIDKLLEDGRKISDVEERRKTYFDFQRFLVEESPAIFLYYPEYFTLERR